ncbi:MAG: dihydrodipicolinate synthase family protein [Piscinibacter sp.]|uniref:dihydrodipicolinate synthase family protein n=1 Tax=Piscinibacter sp. TaxID=1903157 RepID=UPI002583AF9C|nr:dihydrodipicolinate synthase family protein [Piscinibacter sp.]MCW5663321.1 dihydrodipicolinate synthase family protein [Piscinibacter sp.]
MTLTPLPGIWPALLTPLQDDLSIDHVRFAAHARALLQAGCGGVTPFGTTGEGPSFSVAERIAAVDALVAGGVPGANILVSTSCAALPDTLALTRHALAVGAWGVLMLPPFFLKGVTDQGIVDAYAWVLDRSGDAGVDPRLRVMLYHIPQVAGLGLSHAVIAELLRRYPDSIVGIKDSAGDRAHALALADAFMPGLTVHVGHEPDLPALGRRGSTGAVSGLANFMPRTVRRLVLQPDGAQTPAALARIERLLRVLGGYALIPALKGVMAALHDDAAWLRVRAPLVGLDAAGLAALRTALAPLALDPAID